MPYKNATSRERPTAKRRHVGEHDGDGDEVECGDGELTEREQHEAHPVLHVGPHARSR